MEPTYTKTQIVLGSIVALVGVAVLVFAMVSMWNAMFPPSFGPDCEALYNEYEATVDMPTREAIFQHGLDTGCFHYN